MVGPVFDYRVNQFAVPLTDGVCTVRTAATLTAVAAELTSVAAPGCPLLVADEPPRRRCRERPVRAETAADLEHGPPPP
jgi:hypothetical protein